jgi:hypothetical protein
MVRGKTHRHDPNSSLTQQRCPFSRAIERLGVVTPRLSLTAYITNIAESDFRYTQGNSFSIKINSLAAIPSDEKGGWCVAGSLG